MAKADLTIEESVAEQEQAHALISHWMFLKTTNVLLKFSESNVQTHVSIVSSGSVNEKLENLL